MLGLSQTDVSTDGTLISTNRRDTVTAYEVQEHLLIPEYPATDDNGVLHIIHASTNPFQDMPSDSGGINEIFTQLMSAVRF